MVLSFTLNNLLRWQGMANLAVIGLATGGVLNILLDPLFIFGLNMGIGGAGAATLLSQCVSLVILASFFFRGMGSLRVRLGDISRKPGVYATIFKQGMPSFFRQGVVGVSTMALNFNARLYGDAAVAAMSIVSKVFVTVQSVVIGFGQGFQPVLGFNFGAGRLDRVKRALTFSIQRCVPPFSSWRRWRVMCLHRPSSPSFAAATPRSSPSAPGPFGPSASACPCWRCASLPTCIFSQWARHSGRPFWLYAAMV